MQNWLNRKNTSYPLFTQTNKKTSVGTEVKKKDAYGLQTSLMDILSMSYSLVKKIVQQNDFQRYHISDTAQHITVGDTKSGCLLSPC